VVVTGYKWISDSYSVQLPQYAALLVLHDPPGGLVFPCPCVLLLFFRIHHDELGNSLYFALEVCFIMYSLFFFKHGLCV
jgi:hypothetical protein